MKLWQTKKIYSNPGFLLEPRKNFLSELQGNLMQKQHLLGPMTWKVTQRNVYKDIANLRIKQLDNYTKAQRQAWMTINLKKKKMSQKETCLQFARKLFWNVSIWLVLEDLIFYDHSELTCTIDYKMDQGLWQTIESFDHLHSSCMWIPAIPCFVEDTAQQCRLGLFQDSDFTEDLEDSKVNIRRNSVHFRKSHVCASKLEVQETNFTCTQFYGSWSNLSRCRFTHGRYSRSHSLGIGDWSISFRTEQNRWTQERAMEKNRQQSSSQTCITPSQSTHQRHSNKHWSHSIQYEEFWFQCCVACLWRQVRR